MIVYNPKDWLSKKIYKRSMLSFVRLSPYLLISAVVAGLIAYIELELLNLSKQSWLRNITMVHTLLGFVISLLLVFRTNTAYERWWEARNQWGTLTNISRSLAIKIHAFLDPADKINRSFYIKAIPLFAEILSSHLKSEQTKFMLDKSEQSDLTQRLDWKKHGPNQVASMIFRNANQLYQQGKISGEQLIILNGEFMTMMDVAGSCERIKNTPIPMSYNSFIKTFIILYVATLPIGYVFSMGYFVLLAVPFIFYVLATLEIIGESIEDPFGNDLDDVPIDKIAANIRKHTKEIIAA